MHWNTVLEKEVVMKKIGAKIMVGLWVWIDRFGMHRIRNDVEFTE